MTTFDDMFQRIERGIREVYQSDQYRKYLQVMSRFTNYSLNNCILIFQQKPDAQLVAGYQAWKTKFKRNVKRGEKGIRILAPIRKPVKKQEDDEEPEEEVVRFRKVCVFDLSQTEGEPLPSFMIDHIEGSVDDYEDFLEQLELLAPVPVRFSYLENNVHGYYSNAEKEIVLNADMTQLQTVKTLIHEIAHSYLHDTPEAMTELSRARKEIEAESVAYILCRHYGLDTGEYSFRYLAGYSSSQELPELKASMERIHLASNRLIRGLEELRHPQEADLLPPADGGFVGPYLL